MNLTSKKSKTMQVNGRILTSITSTSYLKTFFSRVRNTIASTLSCLSTAICTMSGVPFSLHNSFTDPTGFTEDKSKSPGGPPDPRGHKVKAHRMKKFNTFPERKWRLCIFNRQIFISNIEVARMDNKSTFGEL